MIKLIKLNRLNRLNSLHLAGILLGATICVQSVFAIENARPLATDGRIKVVAFQRNNVVPVQANTFVTTQIVFAKDEVIENIQNGDLAAWTVSVQKGLPNMLFLKPTMLGSNTNMTVVTNLHTYYFHLISNKNQINQINQVGDSTYAIHFSYPEQMREKMLSNLKYNKAQKRAILNAHKNPQDYNWNYSFSGTHSIMPLHIFDDGRFTYLQLQAGQSIPAVFAVNNAAGKESVVNYRRDGQYIVVQQIAPQFSLRAGKHHVASIFNNRLIHKLKTHGEG